MGSESWIFLLLTLYSVGGGARSFENYDYPNNDYGYNQEYDQGFQRSFMKQSDSNGNEDIELRMPQVHPEKHDSYLCTSYELKDDASYIVGYIPHANMKTAHHMLMFGCSEPARHSKEWNCGDMGVGVCAQGSPEKILYAWGRNAKDLVLPKGVAFKVGKATSVKYLVLQTHYASVEKFKNDPNLKDSSGVTIKKTLQAPKYYAAILLLASGGAIPPKKPAAHLKMQCAYQGNDASMHPFAFRVHAHKLGTVISGYRIRTQRDGTLQWTLIGKQSPQLPQAFYPVKDKEYKVIQKGDVLAAQCTYNSEKMSKTTYIGATGKDEMCNFYMMFYYDPRKSTGDGTPEDSCGYSALSGQLDYPKDSDKLPPGTVVEKMEMKRDDIEGECRDCLHKRAEESHLTVERGWPEGPTGIQHDGELPIKPLGQVTGVAMTTDETDVVIFHRASRKWEADTFNLNNEYTKRHEGPIPENTIIWLAAKSGEIKHSSGAGKFYLPHGLYIDHEGYIWVTDVAMHQVFKFSPKDLSKPLMTLGKAFVPGHDNKHFCKPTDVAVDRQGNIFVSDGYCNHRVLKFTKEGNLIEEYKTSFAKNVPAPHSMQIPHSLSLDHDKNILYIADRENGRVLASDTNTGAITAEFKPMDRGARIFAVHYSPRAGGVLYMANVGSFANPVSSFTYSLLNNKVVDWWPSPQRPGFEMPHDVTANNDGTDVYVAEIGPNRIWKLSQKQKL